MTSNSDITARLLEAYDNMGTASREDLKEAADTIAELRDKAFVGNSVLMSVIRELANATGKTVEQIIAEHRWSA